MKSNTKPVDFESLPFVVHKLLGVPRGAISVVECGATMCSGLRITNNSGQTTTLWYDWKTSKIRRMEVDTNV